MSWIRQKRKCGDLVHHFKMGESPIITLGEAFSRASRNAQMTASVQPSPCLSFQGAPLMSVQVQVPHLALSPPSCATRTSCSTLWPKSEGKSSSSKTGKDEQKWSGFPVPKLPCADPPWAVPCCVFSGQLPFPTATFALKALASVLLNAGKTQPSNVKLAPVKMSTVLAVFRAYKRAVRLFKRPDLLQAFGTGPLFRAVRKHEHITCLR